MTITARVSSCLWMLMMVCAGGSLPGGSTGAAPPDPLHAAIDDLATRYPGYPAAAYRTRLSALERRRDALPADAPAEPRARLAAELSAVRREALLAHPGLTRQPLLFVTHWQYAPDHHNTETLFLTQECNTSSYRGGGSALKVLDVAHGTARTVLDAGPTGLIRDPDVSFDGRCIVFSMRKGIADDYHLYEIGADGTGLRQLTRLANAADIDPIHLPDGGIAFTSTREPKYCGCNMHIMANLYRMEGDGANIVRIGGSTLFEGHARLLPDGRILYDRWEYIDRNFGDGQGLWTVNPDGTGHALFWGNSTPSPGGVLDAHPIPGTERVVCTFTSCHDRPWGALAVVDRRLGLDADAHGKSSVIMTWPRSALELVGRGGFDTFQAVRPRHEDPYPLDEAFFLCARELADADWTGPGPRPEMGLYLVDVFGDEVLVHAEAPACFNPVPLAPRPRPPVLPSRRDFEGRPATVYVVDVAQGTHMTGVERGDVKWLRVVQSPEKRHWTVPTWGGQGVQRPAMNWHNFENKRILGTVPVEADGSAHLEVPPDTYVYFQLLDRDGMMIHSMRSGVVFQSGETVSCVGCHDDRLSSPASRAVPPALALRRPPSTLRGWHGPPRLFSYMAEVQPVWDRRCVSCHDFGTPAGAALNLAGDRDLFFNASYEALHQRWNRPDGYLETVGAGPAAIQQAGAWGSRASPLVATLRKGHHDVHLTADEWDRVVTWIDLNAPYYPSYASAYPDNSVGRNPLDPREMGRLETLTGSDLDRFGNWETNRGPVVSFDRPEMSPCLKGMNRGSEGYKLALAILRAGQQRLKDRPRGDTTDFTPCAGARRREEKYRDRQELEQRNRAAIRAGTKVYDP
jgi:hypothetical protein